MYRAVQIVLIALLVVAGGYAIWLAFDAEGSHSQHKIDALLVAVLALEGVAALWQLNQMRSDSDASGMIAIIARTFEHNRHLTVEQKAVLASRLKLNIPEGKESEYWAARLLHLSHLNLLWQVWELSGRKPRLPAHVAGWTEFAKRVVTQLSITSVTSPADHAAADVWGAFSGKNGPWPPEFVNWMMRIDAPLPSSSGMPRGLLGMDE